MSKFLFLLLSNFFLLASFGQQFHTEILSLMDAKKAPFYFGVASGDPDQSSVLLWTKVMPPDFSPQNIAWTIATDTTMQNILQSGEMAVDSNSAFTFKKRIKNLAAGTTYFYQFQLGDKKSMIGRTKTAPILADSLQFAVVSCNNYEMGYFNAYRLLSKRNDLDAVVHLGDYIYEYSRGKYGKTKAARQHIPANEIFDLKDYRSRYAQYRLDDDLQEAHRVHPFITVWDDHEFANNSYKEGADNHQADEGDWEERKAIAKKVYFEWLPIEDNEKCSITRAISYGNLATLFMLDERTEDRCKQLVNVHDPLLADNSRHMIGDIQSSWLLNGMETSTAKWKVIANQVMFSELDAHQLSHKRAKFLDTWDGYPAERKMLMDSFYANKMNNIIVITGDIHTSWALDLVADPQNKDSYDPKTGKGVIGVEFVTPSISSSNLDERVPRGLAKLLGSMMKRKATNPHLRFINVVDHGYVLLKLNNDEAIGEWHFCQTVHKITDKTRKVISLKTKSGHNQLERIR